VTVKQILNASQAHPDADFQIDGYDVSQVSVIGIAMGMGRAMS
jgi:replication factor A2